MTGKGFMSGISQEDIERVREASDLVAIVGERIPLRQRGREFWCCCPFHNEKTPSFKIDPDRQLWHCFGCGEGGDVFGFVMKADGLPFPDAVRALAERAHIELSNSGNAGGIGSSEKARLLAVCKETAAFYHEQLMRSKTPEAQAARDYLSSRKLGGEVPDRWCLGFAPGRGELVRHLMSLGFKPDELVKANVAVQRDGRARDRFFNRVMFPIADAQGAYIAFGGRVIGTGEPKYLNSQETPLFHKSRVLYGLDKAKATMAATGTAIIVEGYTDVIGLHEAGITNAVATLGTALTMSHIRIISRHANKRIVYLFDGDAAGQRAADRALEFIDDSMTPEAGRMRVELFAVTLPDNLDPKEYVTANGGEALRNIIDTQAKPLLKYGIDRRLANADLSTAEGRSKAFSDAIAVLAPIKDSLLAKDYAKQIAGVVRMRETDALDALAHLRPPRRMGEGASENARPVYNPDFAPGQVQGASKLPPTELNRRRFEAQLLALVAQYPQLGLQHADALGDTRWHERVHEQLAARILEILADNPAAGAAQIVAGCAETVPIASRILTADTGTDEATADTMATYLADELAIGDMEDTVAEMNEQLKRDTALDDDERNLLFQSATALQRTIKDRRAAHRKTNFGIL
jgi:DNA primase